MDLIELQYPIGKFQPKESYTAEEIKVNIDRIKTLPLRLEETLLRFNESMLNTPYREGGWTVRQLVHHIADSHSNAYIRFKWTLTEQNPLIKAYFEKLWAETPETSIDPAFSISLLKALHAKWAELLYRLKDSDLERSFIHPETKKEVKLKNLLGLYAWHGDHHLTHITRLKERMGW